MFKMLKKHLAGKAVIIGMTGVALIAVTGILMASTYYDSQKEMLQQQEKELVTISNSVASNMETYIYSYELDLQFLLESKNYRSAVQQFDAGRGNGPLVEILNCYSDVQFSAVKGMYLLNENGGLLTGTSYDFPYTTVKKAQKIAPDKKYTNILKGSDNSFYLGLTSEVFDGHRLMMILDVATMYQKTASYIKMGDKGYVMIKNSDGLILMHPLKDQIGKDVISGRKKQYPDYDFSDLELLIEHQKQGDTNVEIYNSYWWADRIPKKVRKVGAYTPCALQDDFLIVNTVMDYNEIARPLRTGTIKMVAIAFAMILGIGGFLTALVIFVRNRETYKKENQYLKDLNATLEELHRSEEQISHYQRLQTIGTLTGGIAHEFNNLLTPIMGYSGMLLNTVPKEEEMHEDLEEIYASSVKAKEIIQQISALSRKNAETTFKRFDIREELLRSIKVVRSIKPGNIELQETIDLPKCFVMGSETQLSQVILNLCTNAFHSMKGGGTLDFSAQVIPREHFPGSKEVSEVFERYVCLSVKDTGTGIDPAIVNRIFDPFFTTKKEGEGSGLGLSIAQNIIESHKGKIYVSSKLGEGTVFTVYLPIFKNQSEMKIDRVNRPAANFRSILLVDNDRKILHMLQKGLEKSGFSVTSFDSPAAALQNLREHHVYDVMVTDYSMPDMFGTQLAFLAKGINEKMRIVILTGLAVEDVIESKQKHIIDDYLLKPLVCEDLIDKLNTLQGAEENHSSSH